MQIKIILRHRLTPVRIVIIINSDSRYQRERGEKGTLFDTGGNADQHSHMESSFESPLEIKAQTATWSSYCAPRPISEGIHIQPY